MMKYALVCLLTLIYGVCFSQKTLVFEDKIYESQVKTVQISADQDGNQDSLSQAIAPVGQMNLVLQFDDLQPNRANYYARVIHCNYDWTKSFLMDLDYLHDYNEYPINDYALSNSTLIPYFHYRFALPQVKIPGNYLVVVYRDGNKSDIILSRRFMTFSDRTTLIRDNQLSGAGTLNQTSQELNFTIDYSNVDIINPVETIHVILRQNQRWDNAKVDVKPSFVRDNDRQLEFHFYDQDKLFSGGNEFRFVDFRSLTHPGQNTGRLNKNVKPYDLTVQEDKARGDQAYSQYNDLNGNYQIANQDYGEPNTSGNYVNVTFSLNPLTPISDPVYLIGAFNNWAQNEENLMKYYPEKAAYEVTLLMKQGFYNYQYWVNSATLPPNYFEGSHFETENVYEILVYNHAMQPDADLLIGYFFIPVNPR